MARTSTLSQRALAGMTAATLAAGVVGLVRSDVQQATASHGKRAITAKMVAASATKASPEASSTTVEAPAATPAAPAPAPKKEPESGPAYRVVAADGGVFTHGWYDFEGSAAGLSSAPIVGVTQTADGEGYWLTARDGGVFSFGSAGFFGSAVNEPKQAIVGIAATPSSNGYWLAGSDGAVFTYGDAQFFGTAWGTTPLNRPIVAIAATPTGNGYWLVSGDGGVFTFGDAQFFGAAAAQPLNSPVIDLVPTPSGNGYYLVSADGGVFAFGDAPFYGSAASQHLNRPVVDMAVDTGGNGYWLVSRDGGVFSFGEAPFLGAPAESHVNAPIVGIAGGRGTHAPVPAAPPAPEAPAAEPAPAPVEQVAAASAAVSAKGNKKEKKDKAKAGPLDGKFGWDISYPQCGGSFPAWGRDFAIIGVTGGRPFKHNPCLAEQWQWAKQTPAGVYVNVSFPRHPLELINGASSVRQPNCNGNLACIAYNFGFNGVNDALQYAASQGVDVPFLWLDVEQLNYWNPDRAANAIVLRGAIDAATAAGKGAGIYSTPYQYNKIMGGENPGLPVWTAGAPGVEAANQWCVERSFGGGPVAIVQLLPGRFDANVACPGAGDIGTYFKLPS